MIIGIDASNIRSGGGLNHLQNLIKFSSPQKNYFTKIIIWSSIETLSSIKDYPWLIKETNKFLNKGIVHSFFFTTFKLKRELIKYDCDVLFVPGGVYLGSFTNVVSMSQNMLPFEFKEAFRYSSHLFKLKFVFLRLVQTYTFNNSKGVIFLSEYARNIISSSAKCINNSIVIPHGIDLKNSVLPKQILSVNKSGSNINTIEILYISILAPYKHQWKVAQAVCELYSKGYPIKLSLVGGDSDGGINKLQQVRKEYECYDNCIKYYGEVQHSDIYSYYKTADLFIFASTCENFPIILLEAMSTGLPILSSNFNPMIEILDNNEAIFFDPLCIDSIAAAITKAIQDKNYLNFIAINSHKKALSFLWYNTVESTFKFINQISN